MAVRVSRRKLSSYYVESLLAGKKSNRLSSMMAAFLVDNGRKKEVTQLVRDIEYRLGEKGVVLVRVTTASQLTEQARTEISNLVKKRTNASNIQFVEQFDASVIGGIKIEFNGTQIDRTIAKKLINLKSKI